MINDLLRLAKRIPLFFFLLSSIICADKITVYYRGPKTVFVAPYYLFKKQAEQAGPIFEIRGGKSYSLARPARKRKYDRQLFFSFEKKYLTPKLSEDVIREFGTCNIGLLKGKNFHITPIELRLMGFNDVQWYFVEPLVRSGKKVTKKILEPIQNRIKESQKAIIDNPHVNEIAYIHEGNWLCPEEKAYLEVRMPKIKRTLEAKLGKLSGKAPTIAIVASGGGIRAMLATFGFLVGLQKIGLLDAATYICSLSGSTWAVGPWMFYGGSIEATKNKLIPELSHGLTKLNTKDVKRIVDNLLVKLAFNQPLTLVDLYGAILANSLLRGFGDRRHRVYLSEQTKTIKNGNIPFPIYTAIRGEERVKNEWYEFTPYEVGGAWLGFYVPSWAFGRKFLGGSSLDFAPEQTFGFEMGIFGSAFAATFNRLYQEIEKEVSPAIRKIVKGILEKGLGEKRITAGRVFNFTKGLVSPLVGRQVGIQEYIDLVDAGIAFNLPYPPISGQRSERKADIIIFLDATQEPKTKAGALQEAEKYARSNKLPFPRISYKNIKERAVAIFRDEKNPNVPLVIYMPLTKDAALVTTQLNKFVDLKRFVGPFDLDACMKKTCNTFNFMYKKDEANRLSALTEFNVRASQEILWNAISEFVKSRS